MIVQWVRVGKMYECPRDRGSDLAAFDESGTKKSV